MKVTQKLLKSDSNVTKTVEKVPFESHFGVLNRNGKSARSFSGPKFFMNVRAGCRCQHTCFPEFGGPDRGFLAGRPQGYPAKKLPLWADFPFLILGVFGLLPGYNTWKGLKGKKPEGKNFRKLLRRKQSSAKISKISRNTLKPSESDIVYLLKIF